MAETLSTATVTRFRFAPSWRTIRSVWKWLIGILGAGAVWKATRPAAPSVEQDASVDFSAVPDMAPEDVATQPINSDADFQHAMTFTLKEEGGWADHPSDRGGQTMRGVRQKTYDSWRITQGLPTQSVRIISDDELYAIYRDGYWRVSGADRLGWPLSLAVFDFAVNSGPATAVINLQRIVGARSDGAFGPATLASVQGSPTSAVGLTLAVCEARRANYERIIREDATQEVFRRVWFGRVDRLESFAGISGSARPTFGV